MKIGSLARQTGVGVEAIRFYERKGLIEQPPKPNGGGFRAYPQEVAQRIRFIRQAQELGFSLRETSELLSLRATATGDCGDVRERASTKLTEVNQKIEQLGRIKSALEQVIDACPGQGSLRSCSIMDVLEGTDPSKTSDAERE